MQGIQKEITRYLEKLYPEKRAKHYSFLITESFLKGESLDESDDDEGVAWEAQVCEVEKTTGKGKVY